MGIKKSGPSSPPRDKKNKAADELTIGEVCYFFERYLLDEYEITGNTPLYGPVEPVDRKGDKKTPFEGLDETQTLMLYIETIGVRIIHKYSKWENPHRLRKQIWYKCLVVADYLEKKGLISPKKIRFYERSGYLFRCIVYTAEGLGEIILPESEPCALADLMNGSDVTGAHYRSYDPMPPVPINTEGKVKKEAAKRIEEYYDEHFIVNEITW